MDATCGAGWHGRARVALGAGLCLALAALAGCGAPDRAALAPATPAQLTVPPATTPEPTQPPPPTFPPFPTFPREPPFPTSTPETPFYPTATEGTPPPTPATPLPTPTSIPTLQATAVELPPTPALPLDQALGQLAGNTLLYSRNGFLMLTDGQRNLWLTADEAICDRLPVFQPGEWSADGRFLALSCPHAGTLIVALLDMQTGALRQVDAGAGAPQQEARWPGAWSPTAPEFLVVNAQSDGRFRLSIVDAPMGKVKTLNLFEHESYQISAAWSPDGTQVAIYTGNRAHGGNGTNELFLINADGSNRRQFTPGVAGERCRSVEWSRDSGFVYVTERPGVYCTQIAVDTGAETYMNYPEGDQSLHWAPDNKYYLIREWLPNAVDGALPQGTAEATPVERKPYWSLRRADGALVRQFPDRPYIEMQNVAWMPDSQRFVILMADEDGRASVIVVDVAGQATTIMTTNTPISYFPFAPLAIAPDGSLIAISLDGKTIILDPQGQEHATFAGELFGWRPRR